MGRITHGNSRHPLYATWRAMIHRCTDPTDPYWHRYGGRGIRVCDRWHEFEIFAYDVGERPLGHTLDRVDQDGDYEPNNVRWATRSEQYWNSTADRHLHPERHTC